MTDTIDVEVAYALPDRQQIVRLDVPEGTTALQAVKQSQLDSVFDDLEFSDDLKLGVWGKSVSGDRVLVRGERVEIYRPLLADPKEVRKARAARAKVARREGGQSSDATSSKSDSLD